MGTWDLEEKGEKGRKTGENRDTGVHMQLSRRALWKQRLIKDGLSSREDDVVWAAHEDPSFTSWV